MFVGRAAQETDIFNLLFQANSIEYAELSLTDTQSLMPLTASSTAVGSHGGGGSNLRFAAGRSKTPEAESASTKLLGAENSA